MPKQELNDTRYDRAVLAGGCFWGVQYYFDQIPGVVKSEVGYTGGVTKYPTYEQVCSHTTGHAEAILVYFDAKKISYELLLRHFFRMHDPTQLNRQGPDIGTNYRSAIFYFDESQNKIAQKVKNEEQKHFNKPIVTEIEPAKEFYKAEEYHQKYAQKTGFGMCAIPYKELPQEEL